MERKLITIAILWSSIFLFSCQTQSAKKAYKVTSDNFIIIVTNGEALIHINGQVGNNLTFDKYNQFSTGKTYDQNNIIVYEGKITRNEHILLSKEQEYKIVFEPAEVIMVTITSTSENDVELLIKGYGENKIHKINGANKMGLTLGFRNNFPL
jgi:hypothetical protein